MTDEADDPSSMLMEGTSDPDAQATVTDFIDYTEYLPSDLIRSLTLIRGLDESYIDATSSVHELTKTYGQLPNLPPNSQLEPHALRKNISQQLDRAINARESSYAEACRLYDVVDRHFDRLGSIKAKLNALPKPPSAVSRAPSVPPKPSSPENKRGRNQRKVEDSAPATRITLRVDGSRAAGAAGAARQADTTTRGKPKKAAAESRLTSFNPDSPIASTEQSDLETDNGPSQQLETSAEAGETPDGTDGKTPKAKKPKQRKASRTPRPPGMGTNVHSSVAGISTSNALALLKPPSENAKMGSEDLPWLRLTEWEMTKLRKKMKKNAVWQPSEIMIHRELAVRGRGWEGFRSAKAHAEATGEEVTDCDDILTHYVPGKLVRKGEEGGEDMGEVEETKLSNRGMKLNEAKKLKRENLAREQAALAATEAELAARRLSDIGSTFKTLFTSPTKQNDGVPELLEKSSKANNNAVKDREKPKTPKKRKFEETVASDNPAGEDMDGTATVSSTISKPIGKKRKLNKPAAVITNLVETVTGTAGVSNTAKKTTPLSSPTRSKRPAAVAPKAAPTPTPPTTRPPSRRRSAVAASAEPLVSTAARDRPRRKSATPAANKTPGPELPRPSTATAAGRRSKRPAPGPVTSGQDGGAAVSVGRRKAKPAVKKKVSMKEPGAHKESLAALKSEEVRIDEDGVLEEIDPNEPRYCLCGDVSFGTMICCENNDCDKEWFHLDCIGLTDVPSRTAKWYCPDCRQKLGKGVTDGIVKVGGRR